MVKPNCATWRLWLGLGLGALGTVSAVLSIYSNFTLMFSAVSVLVVMMGLVQLSLWSASPVVALSSVSSQRRSR